MRELEERVKLLLVMGAENDLYQAELNLRGIEGEPSRQLVEEYRIARKNYLAGGGDPKILRRVDELVRESHPKLYFF